jgi:hypothetical protein
MFRFVCTHLGVRAPTPERDTYLETGNQAKRSQTRVARLGTEDTGLFPNWVKERENVSGPAQLREFECDQ